MPEFNPVKKKSLLDNLAHTIGGKVISGGNALRRYSRDMSIYTVPPMAVIHPESPGDVIRVMEWASKEGISVTPRGGGSGTAGAALGRGVILAPLKHGPFSGISDFCDRGRDACVTVGAAAIHKDLKQYLGRQGFRIPVAPFSENMCMIGGNIAAKASGPQDLKYGSVDRYLEHLSFITINGDYIDTAREETIPLFIRDGLRRLRRSLLNDEPSVIVLEKKRRRKVASGYNLFPLLETMPVGAMLAQLLAGSAGTLGFIVSAVLRAEPAAEGRSTMLLSFRSLKEAGDAALFIRQPGASAIEIISENTVRLAKERLKSCALFPDSGHLLLVELEGPERSAQAEEIRRVLTRSACRQVAPPLEFTGEADQTALWKIRKQLPPAILNGKPGWKALPVVNDIGVAPEHLARFIGQVERLFEKYELQCAIYGHAGSGNLHLRPVFDLSRPRLGELIQTLADEIYYTTLAFDGVISAEHGMGRLRAPYLQAEWGDKLVGHMKTLKRIFDPGDLLNPGVMFSSQSILANAGFALEAN